jgi:hypothetical protein
MSRRHYSDIRKEFLAVSAELDTLPTYDSSTYDPFDVTPDSPVEAIRTALVHQYGKLRRAYRHARYEARDVMDLVKARQSASFEGWN